MVPSRVRVTWGPSDSSAHILRPAQASDGDGRDRAAIEGVWQQCSRAHPRTAQQSGARHRGEERAARARRERGPRSAGNAPTPQPPRLQRAHSHDHRQARVPGQRLGILAGESASSCGRECRAVARHARDQRRGLGDAEREPVAAVRRRARARAPAAARWARRPTPSPGHPRKDPPRSSGARRVAARLDAPTRIPRVRVGPATAQSRQPGAGSAYVRSRSARRACRSPAPPPRRRAGRPRTTCAARGPVRGSPIPRAMESGWCGPRRRRAAARSGPATHPTPPLRESRTAEIPIRRRDR